MRLHKPTRRSGGAAMNRKNMLTIGIASVCLAVLSGLAISAQDSGQGNTP